VIAVVCLTIRSCRSSRRSSGALRNLTHVLLHEEEGARL
jgi:hypothetical protein